MEPKHRFIQVTFGVLKWMAAESSAVTMAPRRREGKGSGLSLERFIQGKAHRTKAEAKSRKKVIVHKAVRKRAYEKVKKQSENATPSESTSFYDRFFSELNNGEDAKRNKTREHMQIKPDPFFKAKKQAAAARTEKQLAREEKLKRQAEKEKKVNDRKKRHVKLSVRTSTGQPVVRNHIKDILAKLQAERGDE